MLIFKDYLKITPGSIFFLLKYGFNEFPNLELSEQPKYNYLSIRFSFFSIICFFFNSVMVSVARLFKEPIIKTIFKDEVKDKWARYTGRNA